MDVRRLVVVRLMLCVVMTGTYALGLLAPACINQALAKEQTATENQGPAMILKGCQMITESMKAFGEKSDLETTRKLMTESCNVLAKGRDLVMKDEKLMMSSERLVVGLEMMVGGCKMINYGLKKLPQSSEESEGKKLIAEGKNMVTDGKKLFDEGMAKVAPR